MLIHSNEIFDDFMDMAENKSVSSMEKLSYLNTQLIKINLFETLKETKTFELIKKGKLTLKDLNSKYFCDKEYGSFGRDLTKNLTTP